MKTAEERWREKCMELNGNTKNYIRVESNQKGKCETRKKYVETEDKERKGIK